MNCPVCLEDTDDIYTLACGSNTPHQICNACEISMRCSAIPTREGRMIKCPMCRVIEPVQGERSIQSYEAELKELYANQPITNTFDIIIFIENIIVFIVSSIMFILCSVLIISCLSYFMFLIKSYK